MSQYDYIKDIAKSGLKNDQDGLIKSLQELIAYSKKQKKTNFALQLQSILKEALQQQRLSGLTVVGSPVHQRQTTNLEVRDLVIEKLTSDYRFDHLVCSSDLRRDLELFVQEQRSIPLLQQYDLPVANKVLFYGPSGCGKTLAAYVLAGELQKLMYVINLGAVVSSKLGETSKNLVRIFRQASAESCILFIDEFDSLGKLRDDHQDHGEMKRVVNTILQLFDYLPQDSILIAATNHEQLVDEALLRRFDLKLQLDLPTPDQIRTLVYYTLQGGAFRLDDQVPLQKIVQAAEGLSFYIIQKTLITAIKRSLLSNSSPTANGVRIDTQLWLGLLQAEQTGL